MYLEGITKEVVIAVTCSKKKEKKSMSEKATKLNSIINVGFGCERENTRKLISILIDEDLSPFAKLFPVGASCPGTNLLYELVEGFVNARREGK